MKLMKNLFYGGVALAIIGGLIAGWIYLIMTLPEVWAILLLAIPMIGVLIVGLFEVINNLLDKILK